MVLEDTDKAEYLTVTTGSEESNGKASLIQLITINFNVSCLIQSAAEMLRFRQPSNEPQKQKYPRDQSTNAKKMHSKAS